MQRELFEDYVHTPVFIDTKKWRTLPISILGHALAITVVITASLMVSDVLPMTPVMLAFVAPPPAPAVPAAPPPTRSATPAKLPSAVHLDAAPVVAPAKIEPESGVVHEPEPRNVSGVDGGVPGGVPGAVPGSLLVGLNELSPPPPVPEAPIRVSGGIRPPRRIVDVAPLYPEAARKARVSGTVTLDAFIGPDGRVTSTRILKSIPMLDHAALTAVSQWLYAPTLLNGIPVALVMTITVTFSLR